MCSETQFLPASPTSISFLFPYLMHFLRTLPSSAEHLDRHTTDCLRSHYLLFSHTFHGGVEALRSWTAYVYALNLPK